MYLHGKSNIAFFLRIFLKCEFTLPYHKNLSNESILLILIHVFKAIIRLRFRFLILMIILTSIFIESTWKYCFTQSRIETRNWLSTYFWKVYCQSSIIFLSPCECLLTGYFTFATFHLQRHYYRSWAICC